MNPFAAVISIVLSFYTSVVLMRFFMQYFRVDYYNPVAQLVVRATDPFVKPLRKIIPGLWGLDMASLILAWLVIVVHELLILLLTGNLPAFNLGALIFKSIFEVILSSVGLFMFLIFVRAILSWFPSQGYNPMVSVFTQMTEPLLQRIRRKLPPIDGIDLSTMLALLGLFFVYSCITYYLMPAIARLFF